MKKSEMVTKLEAYLINENQCQSFKEKAEHILDFLEENGMKSLIDISENDDEIEHKLAHLLEENVIFCNNGWWYEEEGKGWQKDYITHHVNCNDIFAWACAEGEDVTYNEINDLYSMWKKDNDYGAAAWCIKKRKQMPQAPVEKRMRSLNIWNLDELVK